MTKGKNGDIDSTSGYDTLDSILSELKSLLKPLQSEIEEGFNEPQWPVGLILGNPRSGTTIFMQWMASLNIFSYPSNLLSRFAYAPFIGGLIQKILFEDRYDTNGDFYDIQSGVNFESNLGKSLGALASNEFYHFFRNYMPNYEPKFLSDEELVEVDFNGITKGLASIEKVFGKPFITKGIMLQFHIEHLLRYSQKFVFLYVKRDPLFVMQSILLARKKFYGTVNNWYSVKPKEFDSLIKLDIYHQIAGQVYFTEQSIAGNLKKIPDNNKIIIQYEDFCKNPESIYSKLIDLYRLNEYEVAKTYSGAKMFENRNKKTISDQEIDLLTEAYSSFK